MNLASAHPTPTNPATPEWDLTEADYHRGESENGYKPSDSNPL